tara:strand:- start:7 stop:207 length:201 start_codon:yes stop_codon:yes gene_type:complete
MKKITLITTFLLLSFNTSIFAEEKKCSTFDVGCKVGKFVSETKEYQKEKFSEGKDKIKIPKIKLPK